MMAKRAVHALRSSVLTVATALAVALLLSSCGEDEGPGMTAAQHNEAGWASYNSRDYSGAHSHFSEALGLDPGLTEARLGLAWCSAQQGQHASALADFNEIIDTGPDTLVTDAFAGRAVTALAMESDSVAIASAESTLARSAKYSFGRHPDFDWRDLRLVMAQGYFGLAQYADAQAQVDILDPDNGLDPAVPASWVVGGNSYPTYEAALAMEIEWLWSIVGEGGLLSPGRIALIE